MTLDLDAHEFRLGPIRVCPARLVIVEADEERRVEPRVMEILVLLAERSGETVSREELRDTLWNAYVTDDAIHRAIWKLRRALGEHSGLVETVSKRGYRLARRAEPVVETDAAGPAVSAGAARPWKQRLGVVATAALIGVALWVLTRDVPTPAAPPMPADAEFVPLSSLSGYETQPSVHEPSGQMVFANFPKEGDGALQWDLRIQALDDSSSRPLTRTPAHEMSPSIAPDGERVAFVRMSPAACGFVVLDLKTGVETPTGVDCGVRRGPADCCRMVRWRDANRLLLTRREDGAGPVRIYEFEVDSGTLRRVTDPPAQSEGDTAFALSADGTQVALVRARSAELADLHVLSLDDGRIQQLTSAGHPITGLTWDVGRHEIVFGWNRTGTSRLWTISAQGGEPRPVHTFGMNASNPVVAANDLIYEEWKSEINVWRVDVNAGAASALARSTRWDWRGQPAPDGSSLVFVSNRGGGPELWWSRPDGSAARQLTRLGTQLASPPAWSPDGRSVVIAAVGPGGLDLAIVDVASGDTKWVMTDASDEASPVFTADGKGIYFASNRSGAWEVWHLDLATLDVAQWTRGGGIAARPAGAAGILFVRRGEAGLWRQSATDAEPVLVSAGFHPIAPDDWTVVPAARHSEVFLLRRDDSFAGWLARVDPDTGDIVNIRNLEEIGVKELFAGAGLWVDRDGSTAIVSSVDLSHSDLWLRRGRDRSAARGR